MTLCVETVRTDELGDRSYVVHDGSTAIVIDPQRDIDRIQEVLDRLGLTLGTVAETHIHNDYLTGGLALARNGAVPYLVALDEPVDFDRTPVVDAQRLAFGTLELQVVATPGHTPAHVAYVVTDEVGASAVFSGGSLLYGTVGRTDLIDPARTEELTVAQYRSVRRLTAYLPAHTQLFPTHGFGSFCSMTSARGSTADAGTVADERRDNDALVEPDEAAFVRRTVAGLTPYPAYYLRMAPRNRAGVTAADLSVDRPAEPEDVAKRLGSGEWVVDLRQRRHFAADHLAGSIGVELGPQFATNLGWIYPYDDPLTLLGESAEQVAEAQRQLIRIGIDRPAAVAYGTLEEIAPDVARRSFPRATFTELAPAVEAGAQVVDVRRPDERVRDGAIPDAIHVPLPELAARVDDLPHTTLWVHCASGFRAAIAASLLARAGYEVVLVDDSFAAAVDHHLVSAPFGLV